MSRKRHSRYLLAVLIAGLTMYPIKPAAGGTLEGRGPLGLSAPINAKLESASTPDSKEAVSGSGLSWSAPIKPIGSSLSLLWSLPIDGPLSVVNSALRTAHRAIRPSKPIPEKLTGGISLSDEDKFSQRLDQLLDAALDRNEQSKVLDKAVAHYRTTTQKVIAETKDAADYLVPYRGFGPSSEAGDIILGEKLKIKSRASAEYARQKLIDETHLKVVTNMMQLAMGMGMSDRTRGDGIVVSALGALKELAGEEEAQKTFQMLSSWSKDLSVPESVYKQDVWDVHQKQDKLKYVMETSLDNDPVIHEITKRIHKYNHRSKFARVSAHVVQTTLGVASLTPSFIGPAAKLALLSFVMATGGPESCKLLKELYLDKRFESRWKVINEEAHMALENYQIALLTRNPVLLACTESLVGQMTGPEHIHPVFGTRLLTYEPECSPSQDTGPAPAESQSPALVQSSHISQQ
ncbi:MAG TPA: hypothetical protein V6D08_03030 [Candidatus Obscuribacterales bacterium]